MILPLESDLKPVIFTEQWERLNRDSAWQADERVRCGEEPWYWLTNFVYTRRSDEQSEDSTIERFPAYEYLRYIFHKCFTEPLLAVDKSRQMLLTWVLMAYELWNVQFKTNELITCQTKKEKDADEELIKRADFMWRSEPAWLKPRAVKTFCRFEIPSNKSLMLGIPNGGDQIRSHNPSRHLGDEGGFLEGEFEDCRTAALACCANVKLISTASAGQWQNFIEDSLGN